MKSYEVHVVLKVLKLDMNVLSYNIRTCKSTVNETLGFLEYGSFWRKVDYCPFDHMEKAR